MCKKQNKEEVYIVFPPYSLKYSATIILRLNYRKNYVASFILLPNSRPKLTDNAWSTLSIDA